MYDSSTVTAFILKNVFILDHPILVFNKRAVILEMPGDIMWVTKLYIYTSARMIPTFYYLKKLGRNLLF